MDRKNYSHNDQALWSCEEIGSATFFEDRMRSFFDLKEIAQLAPDNTFVQRCFAFRAAQLSCELACMAMQGGFCVFPEMSRRLRGGPVLEEELELGVGRSGDVEPGPSRAGDTTDGWSAQAAEGESHSDEIPQIESSEAGELPLGLFNYINGLFLGINSPLTGSEVHMTFTGPRADNSFSELIQIQAIGQGLYTYGSLWLLLGSIILLLAMLGPIALCLQSVSDNK